MKLKMVFLLFCLAGSAIAGSAPQKTQAKSSPASIANTLTIPSGWRVYSHQRPKDKVLTCANNSDHEWSISSQRGQIQIRDARRQVDQTLNSESLPFPIPKMRPEQQKAFSAGDHSPYEQTGELRELWEMHGSRTQIKTDIGWVIGFNAGEFGGWLFWFNDDGSRFQRIENVENVVGFMKGPRGLYSLSGLAHMRSNYGKIHRLERNSHGLWTAKEILQLGSSPDTFTQASETTWLILTSDALFRFSDGERMEKLVAVNYSSLYPNSMVLDPSGDIFIGMRHFVTHLKKTRIGYEEEWLVPAGCETIVQKKYKCECTGKR